MIPKTMRAAVITRFGGPEVLEIQDVPTPKPGVGEVLVRVRSSALNRADLLQRAGNYPAPAGAAAAAIPGLEFAGEVIARGMAVTRWREGARVFGVIGGGAHAEYVVAHEEQLAPVPASLDWMQAGAIPEAFITAHDALVTQAALVAGERVLIHAAGSGVGLAATQLVRALGGVPFGTARTGDKIERAREHGLEAGVAVADDKQVIVDACAAWSDGRGMDVILDLVGGDYVATDVAVSATLGRIMLIGTVAGRSASIPLGVVLGKRLRLTRTVLRGRSAAEKAQATAAFARDVGPLLERGLAAPVIDSVFTLDEIRAAHERLGSNETFGKIALTIAGD